MQAPAPARLIEGGLPSDALVAQVLVSKYADHLPLYRRRRSSHARASASTARPWPTGSGALPSRCVPCTNACWRHYEPAASYLPTRRPRRCSIPGAVAPRRGSCGPMRGNDRPWGGRDPPGVAYVYAPDRTAERPLCHLSGFVGVLQVDGYGGYKALADRGGIQLAFCWAHVRRRFYELTARAGRRRSPRRRWSGSRACTGPKRRSAAARPRSGERSARSTAVR